MWNERGAAEFGSCCTTGGGAEIAKYNFVPISPTRERVEDSRALRCGQNEWPLPDNLSNSTQAGQPVE